MHKNSEKDHKIQKIWKMKERLAELFGQIMMN